MSGSANIKPTYQLERVKGNFTRTITQFEEKNKTRVVNGVERIFTTRKLVNVEEKFTDGYMVYYPQGHSILIAADDEDQLLHLELGYLDRDGSFKLGTPRRVDMESGEIVPETFELTPKQIVERKTNGRHRNTTGGIDAAMEG